MVRVVGRAHGFMHFECASRSERGLWHDLTLDQEEMRATCTCMDAQCRKNRRYYYLNLENQGAEEPCYHLKCLRTYLRPFLKEQGVI